MARIEHNVIVRKSLQLARRVPRALRRLRSEPGDYERRPPVFANSFPKSGTHLLVQVLESLPRAVNYGTFIATQPTFPYIQRTREQQIRMIRATAPGEVVSAHLFHDPAYASAIASRKGVHYFIYRDLRDVVVSEAYYLSYMARFHRMHRYFRHRLRSMDERIMTAIRGVPAGEWPHAYPDVATRFAAYHGWLSDPNVLALRYEQVMGDEREATLRRIVEHWADRATGDFDRDQLVRRAAAAIRPERSRTFREARSGGWKEHFTPAHEDAMRRVAGPLLAQLGYEPQLVTA